MEQQPPSPPFPQFFLKSFLPTQSQKATNFTWHSNLGNSNAYDFLGHVFPFCINNTVIMDYGQSSNSTFIPPPLQSVLNGERNRFPQDAYSLVKADTHGKTLKCIHNQTYANPPPLPSTRRFKISHLTFSLHWLVTESHSPSAIPLYKLGKFHFSCWENQHVRSQADALCGDDGFLYFSASIDINLEQANLPPTLETGLNVTQHMKAPTLKELLLLSSLRMRSSRCRNGVDKQKESTDNSKRKCTPNPSGSLHLSLSEKASLLSSLCLSSQRQRCRGIRPPVGSFSVPGVPQRAGPFKSVDIGLPGDLQISELVLSQNAHSSPQHHPMLDSKLL